MSFAAKWERNRSTGRGVAAITIAITGAFIAFLYVAMNENKKSLKTNTYQFACSDI